MSDLTIDLTKKKRVRSGHRGSATKSITRVEEQLASSTPDADKLAALKLTLKEKLDVLKHLDEQIIDSVDGEDEIAREIELADTFSETIYDAIVKVERHLSSLSATPTTPPPRPALATASSSTRVRLPKLHIKPFNGDLTTWTPFWESFSSSVHDNRDLTPTDKFTYLRSLLERVALDAISGLSLSESNYDEAISILKRRFGSKQKIIDCHMDALISLEPVVSNNNLRSLRQLYDSVEMHTRSLKSLGITPESYGGLLTSVLIKKLPQELQLFVSRKVKESDWSLIAIMEVIEEELRARERTVSVPTPMPYKRTPREPPTAAALFTGSANLSCTYCQQPHTSASCHVVTEPQGRKQSLQRSGRCFICLRRGHVSRECRSSSRCQRCNGKHHVSLCTRNLSSTSADKEGQPESPVSNSQAISATDTALSTDSRSRQALPIVNNPSSSKARTSTSSQSKSSSSNTTLWICSDQAVLLQTAQAVACNPEFPEIFCPVRLVLDCGSQRSYVTEWVIKQLSVMPRVRKPLTVMTFGSHKKSTQSFGLARLNLVFRNGETTPIDLYTIPHVCEPVTCQPVSICKENFGHLATLDLADPSDGSSPLDIDILIGSDFYWEFVTGDTRRGPTGPIAIDTKFGWVLSGPATSSTDSVMLITHSLCCVQNTTSLEDRLNSFWELESFGVSGADLSIHDKFKDSVNFVDGRYEVKLPWREMHPTLPNNYSLCLKRLRGLLKRLRHNPDILQEYHSTIQDQLKQGIVEPVINQTTDKLLKIHYLPHHAVVRHTKDTTKLRVVYDASAHSSGPSLNDCLHAGPKFEQKIFDLLMRFRIHKVAITADVEKAFLMISVSEPDRDALRFLWVKNICADDPVITELRFTRVVFGVSSSPFLLNATIQHHLEQYLRTDPDLIHKLRRSFYVDDFVTGAADEEQAHQLFVRSKEIMKSGGFNLRKFSSNSLSLQSRVHSTVDSNLEPPSQSICINEEDTYTNLLLDSMQPRLPAAGMQKVLGVPWDVHTDSLVISFGELVSLTRHLIPTKRNLVSLAGKFFDPLGFLSPFVVSFKILLQDLCKAKITWEEPLADSLLERWKKLSSSLEDSQPFIVPRCYMHGITGEISSATLCGFADASSKAYAGVVYLVLETSSSVSVTFLTSKTRVSPMKEQTIPRLELLAALLLGRLVTAVTNSLESELVLSSPRCFTDSSVALFWIKGITKTWKPFVQNRVEKIRELVPPSTWRHCSGRENPADLPSRGATLSELSSSILWREGPSWLLDSNFSSDIEIEPSPECLAELTVKDQQTHGLLTPSSDFGLCEIIDCSRFSTLNRLLTVTKLVLKFCKSLLSKIRPNVMIDCDQAEKMWIVESQKTLSTDANFKQWKRALGLFQDNDGIWRCQGRLQYAAIPYSTIHPVLLHKSHHFTLLVVRRAHKNVLHNGVSETLAEVRANFWIAKGRSFVKSIIRRCQVCRRHEGPPYASPLPPPLPKFRVEEAPAFSFTGVDFAGPLYIKSEGETRKTWICLYTCLVVRAVHLDLVMDLTTSSFLHSFCRFAARRGTPLKMLSDNGKTFLAALKVIHEVKWKFNVPKAPWWGGVFERLIRSTKRCLRKTIGGARLDYDELLTVITEVEMVINSRPLVYSSASDLEEPLTPAHLMVGRRLMSVPNQIDYESDSADETFEVDANLLTRRTRYLNTVINRFWVRWRREYLLELREAHKQRGRNSNAPQVSVGDIVIVHEDDLPRAMWKLGLVVKLLTGSDGETRAAELRVAARGRESTSLTRPVQKLYPMELNTSSSELRDSPTEERMDDQIQPRSVEDSHASPDSTSLPTRVRRKAAMQARDRVLAQSLDQNLD